MRKIWITLAVILLALAGMAYAATQGATVSEGPTGKITTTTAGSDIAEGGNVTRVNLTATVSTDKWQGYYGNVTGTLSLGYLGSSLYDFSGATPLTVFATQNQTFDWAGLTYVDRSTLDTDWGYVTASDNDQAVDVFDESRSIGGVTVNATELNGAAGTFYSGIFSHGTTGAKGYYAFGTNVTDGSSACFNTELCDYELMVPVDVSAETYYFYVEI